MTQDPRVASVGPYGRLNQTRKCIEKSHKVTFDTINPTWPERASIRAELDSEDAWGRYYARPTMGHSILPPIKFKISESFEGSGPESVHESISGGRGTCEVMPNSAPQA